MECHFEKNKLHLLGADTIVFKISPNAGYELKPMHKIASGGELSRILLAVKSAFNSIDTLKTLLFDEIDTGVGGIAATKIGEFLSHISKSKQVFWNDLISLLHQF